MLNRRRAAALAGLMYVAAGCGVNDDNIEHWKHTQRGPRKIMTVLVGTNYPQPLRVHAARALVEMNRNDRCKTRGSRHRGPHRSSGRGTCPACRRK